MGRCIQINYDLIAPGKNYDALIKYLKSFDGYSHALQSMWFVRTTKTPKEIMTEVLAYVDRNDKVVVIDITDDAWWTHGMPGSVLEWMHGHTGSQLKVA